MRLAPCSPPVTSPAANRPGTELAPAGSMTTPPMVWCAMGATRSGRCSAPQRRPMIPSTDAENGSEVQSDSLTPDRSRSTARPARASTKSACERRSRERSAAGRSVMAYFA